MRNAQAGPFTGRHMLIIMLAFFAVVLSANMTLVYFARHSWTGLVVKNSYVASQEFNEKTAAMVKAAQVDAHISVGKEEVSVTLTTKTGEAVHAESVVLSVGRPSHEGEDRSIPLAAQGDGSFAARHGLARGQWSGFVTARIPGQKNWSRPILILVEG
jgi:nitrogen fixation protein FixH